jgi:hypothetical protein
MASEEHESVERELFRAIEHPEYERVCKGCGTHWDVPSAFVHSAANASAGGSVLAPSSTGERVEEFDSDVREYDTCPGCGAYKTFTEHHLFEETRQQDILENEENEP